MAIRNIREDGGVVFQRAVHAADGCATGAVGQGQGDLFTHGDGVAVGGGDV